MNSDSTGNPSSIGQAVLEDSFCLGMPPPEDEIIAGWTASQACLVSICMLTYNHAHYLRSALNGILCQDTDFGFEILIHDDASTDATQDIIREYHERYPHIVKPILQTVNQYSRGGRPSVEFNYPRANAEFVAWCEGDDCWTDKAKLRLQITGLRQHPEVDLSFHQAVRIDYSKPDVPSTIMGEYSDKDGTVSFIDILHRKRGGIPFASCIVRQSAMRDFFNFLKDRDYLTVGDLYLQFFGSIRGGALYFARPMSVYRLNTTHSWTRSIVTNLEKKSEHEVAMIRSYAELDRITGRKFTDEFRKLVVQRVFWLFDDDRVSQSMLEQFKLHELEKIYAALQDINVRQVSEIRRTPQRFVVYGAGSGCALIMRTLKCEEVAAIIDRDGGKVGETMYGIPVDSVDNLRTYPGYTLVISTFAQDESMLDHLVKKHGVDPSHVIYFYREMIAAIDMDNLLPATEKSLELYKRNKQSPREQPLPEIRRTATAGEGDADDLYEEFQLQFKRNFRKLEASWTKHEDRACDWILDRVPSGTGVDVGATTYIVKKLQDRADCEICSFNCYVGRNRCIKKHVAADMFDFGKHFAKTTLDFITARRTLEYSVNPLFQLWQFNRALKDQGRLIVAVPRYSSEQLWLDPRINCVPLENWLMLFKRAGFVVAEFDTGTFRPDDPGAVEYRFMLQVVRRSLDMNNANAAM